MAYEKTTWAKGDVVTSAKLNKMEDGIASNVSPIVVANTRYSNLIDTLDITPADLFNEDDVLVAIPIVVFSFYDEHNNVIVSVPAYSVWYNDTDKYHLSVMDAAGDITGTQGSVLTFSSLSRDSRFAKDTAESGGEEILDV